MLQTRIQITNLNAETTCWILKPILFLLLSWISNLRGRRVIRLIRIYFPFSRKDCLGTAHVNQGRACHQSHSTEKPANSLFTWTLLSKNFVSLVYQDGNPTCISTENCRTRNGSLMWCKKTEKCEVKKCGKNQLLQFTLKRLVFRKPLCQPPERNFMGSSFLWDPDATSFLKEKPKVQSLRQLMMHWQKNNLPKTQTKANNPPDTHAYNETHTHTPQKKPH